MLIEGCIECVCGSWSCDVEGFRVLLDPVISAEIQTVDMRLLLAKMWSIIWIMTVDDVDSPFCCRHLA